MEEQFKNAKIGDKVWDIRSGWGKITRINNSTIYRINVQFNDGDNESFMLDSKQQRNDILPVLFWDEIKFDIPPKPKQLITKTVECFINLTDNEIKNITNMKNYISFSIHKQVFSTKEQVIAHQRFNLVSEAKVTIEYQIEE